MSVKAVAVPKQLVTIRQDKFQTSLTVGEAKKIRQKSMHGAADQLYKVSCDRGFAEQRLCGHLSVPPLIQFKKGIRAYNKPLTHCTNPHEHRPDI